MTYAYLCWEASDSACWFSTNVVIQRQCLKGKKITLLAKSDSKGWFSVSSMVNVYREHGAELQCLDFSLTCPPLSLTSHGKKYKILIQLAQVQI